MRVTMFPSLIQRLTGTTTGSDIRYQPLNSVQTHRKGVNAWLAKSRVIGLILFTVFVFSSAYLWFSNFAGRDDYQTYIQDIPSGDRKLVVLFPADNPGPPLCKAITSGLVNGYPMPVIVNWGMNHQDIWGDKAGNHPMKITGMMNYLDDALHPDCHEDDKISSDDLIVVIDSYDSWFQLPAQVLVSRYHEANRKANERLARQWKGKANMSMGQTIIVSAQKRCWPTLDMGSDLHCEEIPESSLRSDVYGPNTDIQREGDEVYEYHDVRPRFLNSGAIIGPAGDMQRYLRRVVSRFEKMIGERKTYVFSDQGIFGEIFAEQEMYRNWRREQGKSLDVETDNQTALVHNDFEYHVGLDYQQDIFVPTVFAEMDGDIYVLKNQTDIDQRSRDLNINTTRLTGVPEDMKNVSIPSPPGVKRSDWGELPIYGDLFTTSLPVVVHHNAHRDGLKERQVWLWDKIWFFSGLREMVIEKIATPEKLEPIAKIPASDGGELVYWPLPSDQRIRRPRNFRPGKMQEGLPGFDTFDEICRSPDETPDSEVHWYDEVFRDGKGGLDG